MRFTPLRFAGAWLIGSEKHADQRGFFARLRCSREFQQRGLPQDYVQVSVSHNAMAGTFRGLHFQVPPSREGKLVCCLSGSISDIIVDLRPDSGTFLEHLWVKLDSAALAAVFIPTGLAHGFLTHADNTLVLYEMTDFHAPELGHGCRWDDPALGIELPFAPKCMHPRDGSYPDLDPDSLSCFSGQLR